MTGVLDVVADAELWRLSEETLWDVGAEVEQRRRVDYARQVEVVAELWGRTGRSKDDLAAIVAEMMAKWRVTRAEAKELLRHAELFRREGVRLAARDGVLSTRQLNVIDKALSEAPEADRDDVEAALVENAGEFDATALRTIARHILQLLDQDGKAPDDPELAEPKRELHLASRKDGSVVFRGKIDQETGAKLEALLSPLAKPTSAQDTRTTPERQGDALAEIIDMASASEDLPQEGGERPHLALTMRLEDFLAQRGTADVEGMGPMNAASVRRIACDAKVLRIVLGANSEPLDIGRATRTIPNQIRRALIVRDGG